MPQDGKRKAPTGRRGIVNPCVKASYARLPMLTTPLRRPMCRLAPRAELASPSAIPARGPLVSITRSVRLCGMSGRSEDPDVHRDRDRGYPPPTRGGATSVSQVVPCFTSPTTIVANRAAGFSLRGAPRGLKSAARFVASPRLDSGETPDGTPQSPIVTVEGIHDAASHKALTRSVKCRPRAVKLA
jgi:hypothetical protein